MCVCEREIVCRLSVCLSVYLHFSVSFSLSLGVLRRFELQEQEDTERSAESEGDAPNRPSSRSRHGFYPGVPCDSS